MGERFDNQSCLDWVPDQRMKQVLESPEYWSKDWDTKKTEASEADVEFVKKYQPVKAV